MDDVRPRIAPAAASVGAPAHSLREIERSALEERVRHHRGTRAELARDLGLSERSLYRKLKALKLASS